MAPRHRMSLRSGSCGAPGTNGCSDFDVNPRSIEAKSGERRSGAGIYSGLTEISSAPIALFWRRVAFYLTQIIFRNSFRGVKKKPVENRSVKVASSILLLYVGELFLSIKSPVERLKCSSLCAGQFGFQKFSGPPFRYAKAFSRLRSAHCSFFSSGPR